MRWGAWRRAMWRDYYAHDYKSAPRPSLFPLPRPVSLLARRQRATFAYNFGKAAQLFQPTSSRAGSPGRAALPRLTYYTLLRDRSGEKLRRRQGRAPEPRLVAVAPGKCHAGAARQCRYPSRGGVVQGDNEHLQKSAQLRAAMMRYRDDRRDGHMQPEDWDHIEQNLIEAYRELRTGRRPHAVRPYFSAPSPESTPAAARRSPASPPRSPPRIRLAGKDACQDIQVSHSRAEERGAVFFVDLRQRQRPRDILSVGFRHRLQHISASGCSLLVGIRGAGRQTLPRRGESCFRPR